MSFDTNFSEVRSAQNVAGAAFEGSNILFDWIIPNEKACDLDECYQYHKLNIVQCERCSWSVTTRFKCRWSILYSIFTT